MNDKEKAAYNKAIDDCVKFVLDEGYSHTAGLTQFLANQIAGISDKLKKLKI